MMRITKRMKIWIFTKNYTEWIFMSVVDFKEKTKNRERKDKWNDF